MKNRASSPLRQLRFSLGVLWLGTALGCSPSPSANSPSSEAAPSSQEAQNHEPTTTSALAEVKERGKLVVLTVPHQENVFTKTNLENGPMKRVGTREDFMGIDIGLIAAFADHIGVDLEIRPALSPQGIPGYEFLIPALLRGEGDVIASSFTINEERDKVVDFSDPYFRVYRAVVARVDKQISSLEDLQTLTPVVLPGTSQETYLLEAGFAKSDILFVEFSLETYSAVLEGDAGFTVRDSTSAEAFVKKYTELEIPFPFDDTIDEYGFAVAEGSDLRDAISEFFAELKANGKLDEMTRL